MDYRRIQYVEVVDPDLPKLQLRPQAYGSKAIGNKAVFPVLAWELDTKNNILAVQILITPGGITGDKPITRWLQPNQFKPYTSTIKGD